METVAFCEIDPFCRKVLKKHWPDVPIFEDIKTLRGEDVGTVDVICGGWPCQPFSVAGKRDGANDDRHLWPEVFRLVRELRPRWIIGENVAGIITMELDTVLFDLESEGHAAQAFIIPACAVDAPHRRDRVWIVAHAEGERCGEEGSDSRRSEERVAVASSASTYVANAAGGRIQQRRINKSDCAPRWNDEGRTGGADMPPGGRKTSSEVLANPNTIGRAGQQPESDQKRWQGQAERSPGLCGGGWQWPVERGILRLFDGLSAGMGGRRLNKQKIKAFGNAVVPQIPEMIGRAILDVERTLTAESKTA